MKLDIFKEMEKNGTEQVIFNYSKETGLKAIVVIDNTDVGPAMGGCRMLPYKTEEEALVDGFRLAKGMTLKTSIAKQSYGGGKTIIIGDPKTDKNELLFRDLGRFIQTLNGRYYMGTDVGTSGYDLVDAAQESDYMVGLPEEFGGYGDSAKPTAYGIYMTIKASAKAAYGDDSLKGLTIAVQGVGTVGSYVVDYIIEEEANVIITDVVEENINAITSKYPQIKVVGPDEIYEQECDVFTPCALGAIINDDTIPKLKCKIIAGSANNQLAEPRHAQVIHDKGILFAPDFVANCGGFISASDTVDNGNVNHDRVMGKTAKLYDIMLDIYKNSKEHDVPTDVIAHKIAEERIESIAQIKRKYVRD